MRAPRAVLGAVILIGACGDPAVDGSYEGEARFELDGLVCAIGKMPSPTTAIGVMWTTIGADASRSGTRAGEAQTIDTRALPADFHVSLFDTPPAGFSTAIESERGVLDVAIGIPYLFDDLDGDGTLEPQREPVLGVARGQFVLHSTLALPSATTDVPLAVEGAPDGWGVGKAICDTEALIGLEVLPSDTRFDVWLFDGVIDNPLESLAPKTCLMPF
jgi:hypothetical protein